MNASSIIQPNLEEIFRVVRDINLSASIDNFKGATQSVKVEGEGRKYSFDIFFDHGGETLTFYGEVDFPHAGFATTAGSWNNQETIGPLITLLNGYALKFDVNISYGVTKATLKDVIYSFEKAFAKLVAHREDAKKRNSI